MKFFPVKLRFSFFLLLIVFGQSNLWAGETFINSHLKYELLGLSHPTDSLMRKAAGAISIDQVINLRLNFSGQQSAWEWRADYQLAGQFGDSMTDNKHLAALSGGNTSTSQAIQNDDRRLIDLTEVSRSHDRSVVIQRLDRFYIGYTGDKSVIRLGRQAVSWGNGLFYNPMDVFNPFDPTAVDKEYKTGDDMLYAQYLKENGDDLQTVFVARRNAISNKLDADKHSFAIKYHGFIEDNEFDILLAQHYDEELLGIGGVKSIGGAVWRADLTVTDTDDNDLVTSLVTNLSYSWMWYEKNVSGMVEYFHNGFGQEKDHYTPIELFQNTALLRRMERGELFTVGKNYLAASATIEVTPLWLVSSSVFGNLDDHSALLQITSLHDLDQDLQLIFSFNVPIGANNTEFGGIDSGLISNNEMLNLKPSRSFFAQVAWYF